MNYSIIITYQSCKFQQKFTYIHVLLPFQQNSKFILCPYSLQSVNKFWAVCSKGIVFIQVFIITFNKWPIKEYNCKRAKTIITPKKTQTPPKTVYLNEITWYSHFSLILKSVKTLLSNVNIFLSFIKEEVGNSAA